MGPGLKGSFSVV